MDYIFMTDSDSDLPLHLKEELDIPVVEMPYAVEGREYFDDLGKTLDYKTYYDKMRAGAVPTTSALNEAAYTEIFEPLLAAGKDILFIAFSSRMSVTLQALARAREKLLEKYPGRVFRVVDTLSISAPMTILVLKAHAMYRAGKSIEEVAGWVEANRFRAQGWVTVEDLKYLKRGGRIKPVAAAVGTLLDLKPIIIEDKDGLMVSVDKVRGRRRALSMLMEKGIANIDDPREACPMIIHADAPEDAKLLKQMIQERMPELGDIAIEMVGPVIGAHCGPGTIAFCFFGKERPQ